MTEKTVIIWDQMDGEIKFAVVDGDYTKLDGTYLNASPFEGEDESDLWKRQDEVNGLFYNPEDGSYRTILSTTFPTQAVKDGASVIVCGFLP